MILALLGCAGVDGRSGRPRVAASLEERTGHPLRPDGKPSPSRIPPGVSLDDGLTSEEAVALALWNNAAFQETLATLGLSRADLIEAGLLKNPVLSVLFPVGTKQLEFAATLPLEAFFFRPKRVDIARIESERVAEGLVENGLELARLVKAEHAGLILARERSRIAGEALALRGRIAEARLRAGDLSGLEASTARIDALRAAEESRVLLHEVTLAEGRLRTLLGLAAADGPLLPTDSPADSPAAVAEPREEEELVREALAARPDLRAAELAVEAAGKRARLARREMLALSAILDANERRTRDTVEMGPGLEFPIPIFNWNQGGMARADAEVERAVRRYSAVRDRISLEVRQARTRLVQAREDLETWRARILPPLEVAVRQAESAFRGGEASFLLVLETTRQLSDARRSEAEAAAGLRLALGDLERSVGRRLSRGEGP